MEWRAKRVQELPSGLSWGRLRHEGTVLLCQSAELTQENRPSCLVKVFTNLLGFYHTSITISTYNQNVSCVK